MPFDCPPATFLSTDRPDAHPSGISGGLPSSDWPKGAEMARNANLMTSTRERNKADHTWALLQTRGFLEELGPEKVFQSETSASHGVDGVFLKHVSEGQGRLVNM